MPYSDHRGLTTRWVIVACKCTLIEQCVKHLRLFVQVCVGGEGRGRSPFELCSHTLIHQSI